MQAQKYNLLPMYGKFFMQFKTNVPSFIVFLAALCLVCWGLSFFLQLAGYAVGGVYFEYGGNEEQHYPVVMYISKVVVIAVGYVLYEERQQRVVGVFEHQRGGEYEQGVAY